MIKKGSTEIVKVTLGYTEIMGIYKGEDLVYEVSKLGRVWQESELPHSLNWLDVCYGEGFFIAVPYDANMFAYSSDGKTWDTKNLYKLPGGWLPTESMTFQCITYHPISGLFIVLPYGSYSYQIEIDSSDGEPVGVTKRFSLPVKGNWSDVVYGDNKIVGICYNSNVGVIGSIDSNKEPLWTKTTLPASRKWQSVTYGNGKFVAVSQASDKGAYTTDGTNWTEMTLPLSVNWYGVAYGNGYFVAVPYNGKHFAVSTDGINWIDVEVPVSSYWQFIAYGDGQFVAISNGKANVLYCRETPTDPASWEKGSMPSARSWKGLAYGDGKFVSVAYNSDVSAYTTH